MVACGAGGGGTRRRNRRCRQSASVGLFSYKIQLKTLSIPFFNFLTISFNNNQIAREEPGPRGIWGRVQGVDLVQGVTRSGLVCDTPSARSADAREARFLVE